MDVLSASASLHVRDCVPTREIILNVCIVMTSATVYGVAQFGIHSLFVILATVLAAVLSEYLWQCGMKKKVTIADCSAVVTGLILAFNMPPEIPFQIPAFSAVFAIIIAKQMFSGLGQNFINPAPAGRCFLLISLAKYMNNSTLKSINSDATAGVTPLAVMKAVLKAGTPATADTNLFQLFMRRIPGTTNETSATALLFGTAYLLWREVISFEIPVIHIVATVIFVFAFGEHSLNYVLAQVPGGSLIFGVFFMATDYASTPLTRKGQVTCAVTIGILTGFFCIFGTDAEGVPYSIIIDDMLSSLIEGTMIPKVFGRKEAKKA